MKHIRVEQTADNSKYYLADCKMFNSIPVSISTVRNISVNFLGELNSFSD